MEKLYSKLRLTTSERKLFDKVDKLYSEGNEFVDRNKLERAAGSPGIIEKLIKKGILELDEKQSHLKLDDKNHKLDGEARYKLNISV